MDPRTTQWNRLDGARSDTIRQAVGQSYMDLIASNPLPDPLKAALVKAVAGDHADAALQWAAIAPGLRLETVSPHDTILLHLARSWLDDTPEAIEHRRRFRDAAGPRFEACMAALAFGASIRVAAHTMEAAA